MSVIQKIRDKYARVAVIAIAVALLGFILTDYISGRGRNLFNSGNTNMIGRVNGKKIDATEFEKKVKQQEDYMQQQQQQQGFPQPTEVTRQQAIEAVWNDEVNRVLMSGEFSKLGISVGKKEIDDMLFGANPPDDLKKQFTDPQTGQYNAAEALRQIREMKRKGTTEQKDNFNTYVNQLEYLRQAEKYNSLISNSTNYPRWILEKQNAEGSLLGRISLVREVYSSIPDSTIKITDKEIADYISKHKEDYKQEKSRSISYVTFSANPSAADSLFAKNKALALKTQFDTTKDVQQLLAGEGVENYYKGYISSKIIQVPGKDSIFKTPVGHVYGPYLDGGNYTLAKVEATKQIPDTVKVRHILVATTQQDPQSRQMVTVRDSATARHLIDSIKTAIDKGSNFDSVCVKLSEDPGSKDKGGVYENVTSGKMVSEFNNFIFSNPTGSKGIVKTEFGYHYIEILSQKGSNTGYQIAYLPTAIVVSNETDENASNEANVFAGDSRDMKSFDANFEKSQKPKGKLKGVAPEIKPTDAQVQGLQGISRTFVKNLFAAKKGAVLQPEKVGSDYVVAVVTEINEEGTQPPAKARLGVEPLLRNEKKAEMLKQKLGKITTLEAAASVLGKQIETADSLRTTGKSTSTSLGYEPRIIGAAFNPANKGKVVPEALEGQSGVYVIRVENVSATAVVNANVAEMRKAKYQSSVQQQKQMMMYGGSPIAAALKAAANIVDKRADRF